MKSPERLDEPSILPAIDRRRFIQLLGGGVAVLFFSGPTAEAQRRRGWGREKPPELEAWIHIGADGTVSVFTGKTEVGQNIRTSLSQVVAEELRTPLPSIRMVMADTDLVPWDAGTFGSRTTPDMASYLRRAAATARETLIELAAKEWGVEREKLEARDGLVTDGERSVFFGQLSQGKELVATITDDVPTAPATEWKIAGTSVPKVDGRSFVTGAHRYSTDIRRPGMVHGKVLRPAAYEAKLVEADLSKAEALEGVAVHRDGDFIGVTATSAALAAKALAAIDAEWKGGQEISHRELFEHLRKTSRRDDGDRDERLEEALAGARHKREANYTVAYIAHAPLEPRAAVAEWDDDGKLTVWTGTQRPFGVKDELMREFSLPGERVRVIVPDTGSGFGGKHSGECAVEAARLAKSAGRPVKLVWTREEEFTWAYFRPAGVIEARAGIDADGKLTAWDFHNHNSGGAAIETPYDVPHRATRAHGSDSPLRQGSYRGLASAANAFARESFMDELAAAAELDPLEFRLRNLSNDRLRAVLEAAAERFGWKDRKTENGRASGLACGIDKGGYIANCVEVDTSGDEPKVTRIVAAFECGAVLHPAHVKQQVEGSIVMGIGGALFEAIRFEKGRILNPAFSKYRVPKFSDVPPIEIILLDRKDLPSAGAGEAPILAIAPAIGNAIAAATGKRHRALPMAGR